MDTRLFDAKVNPSSIRSIGGIGNYYGGLSIKTEDGKYYWSIENYDGHDWQCIPEKLYRALTAYDDEWQSTNR